MDKPTKSVVTPARPVKPPLPAKDHFGPARIVTHNPPPAPQPAVKEEK